MDTGSNAVYFPDWSGKLYKLNLATGAVIWSHPLTDYGLPAGFISRTTPTLSGNLVIIGAGVPLGHSNSSAGAYLAALDSTTGNLVWRLLVDSSLLATITGSPVVYNGVIYIGVSSGQEQLTAPTFRGSVIAVSETSGQVLWQTYMVPQGYSGAPIWSSTPAIDLTRNQLYVTTGNNYSVPGSVQACEVAAGNNAGAVVACQDPANYEDSIVALDLATGAIKWGTKCSSTDAWISTCLAGGSACPKPPGADYDFGAGANFFTATINGVRTDLVGAGQKSGVYWALNPSTGAVVWKQAVGPGGILGGIEWGTATDNQRIYIALSNARRASYALQPSGMPWGGGSWAALDAGTGKFLWQVPDPGMDPIKIGSPAMALGAVTVANGILYCADTAGLMFALDASTGNTLWTFQAPGSVNAAPAITGGMLFWGSGYHNFPAAAPIGTASNQFYSFALPPPLLPTQTNLVSSLNPSITGQTVILTATVAPASASGTVAFLDGSTPIGSAPVVNGVAALALSTLAPGSHALTAAYSGDSNDAAGTSPVLTQTVSPMATSTTTLTSSPNPSAFGQAALLTAAIAPATAGGIVTFSDGGMRLGSAPVIQGSAVLQTGFAAGVHSLSAAYSGDVSDSPSISNPVSQIVNAPATPATATLSISPSPSQYGQIVVLKAAMSPSSATGEITFYDGATVLGTEPLVNGQAALATILLPSGARFLRAHYGGDAADGASTSPSLPQAVSSLPGNGFQTVLNQVAGPDPVAIASGDFNADGKLDFAVATFGSPGVSVLLGNGDGTFQAPVAYFANSPYAVATGDFNGDGKADIVTADDNQNVAVLLGNGDGTFQPAVMFPAGNSPVAVSVADFNGDGRADVVVANGAGASIAVLLGNGDGTLQPPTAFATGKSPSSLAIGDFNGDGITDVTAVNSTDNTVSVLLGKGDGTFQAAQTYSAGSAPNGVIAGDFNWDGKLDFAVTNGGDGTLSVFAGNGDGTFKQPVAYPAGSQPDSVTIGDFNGDEKPDLAVADYASNGAGTVSLLLGNGDGSFQAPVIYPVGSYPSFILAGDINGDGRADLAIANDGGNSLSLLLAATPPPTTSIALSSSINPASAGQSVTLTAALTPQGATGTVVFLDGSAILGTGTLSGGNAAITVSSVGIGSHPLTAFYSGDSSNGAATSALLIQTISGLATATVLATNPNPSVAGQMVNLTATISPAGATGTVTFRDGQLVIGTANVIQGAATIAVSFTAGPHSLTAIYGGDGTYGSSSSEGLTQPVTLPLTPTTISLSSSANPSVYGRGIIVTAAVSPASASGTVTLYDGTAIIGSERLTAGQAAFHTAQLASGTRSLSAYYAGDTNNTASSSTVLSQAVNTVAAIGFQSAVSYGNLTSPAGFATGDLNGDGKTDLVVANSGFGNVAVMLGNGDGTFQAPQYIAPGTNPAAVTLADFNGDGNPDIAVANSSGSAVILTGNGDGTFQPPMSYALGGAPSSITVGDFNGDGKADIVTANAQGGNVSVLLGSGDGTFQASRNYAAGTQPYSVVVGDWNGDGQVRSRYRQPHGRNCKRAAGQWRWNFPGSDGL